MNIGSGDSKELKGPANGLLQMWGETEGLDLEERRERGKDL